MPEYTVLTLIGIVAVVAWELGCEDGRVPLAALLGASIRAS